MRLGLQEEQPGQCQFLERLSRAKLAELHVDVSDPGIPITAAITGANVRDSQVAIPLEKLTERKVTFLYSLMDSAYEAQPITNYIEGKGRVPLIDPNKRRGGERVTFPPAQKEGPALSIRRISSGYSPSLSFTFEARLLQEPQLIFIFRS